jgi:two-component system sensor histidine kinase/response regulator
MRIICLLLCFFCLFETANAQNKVLLDSLQKVYKTAKHDTTRILALTSIAYEYKNSKPDTCIAIAEKILTESEKIGFEKGKAKAYNCIGYGNYMQEKYTEALIAYQKAVFILEKIKDTKGLAGVFYNIGRVYYYQNNYPLAIEYYQKGLKIADKTQQSSILRNIGVMYFHQKNYALSLEYSLKGLKIEEEIGVKQNIATMLMNIGVMYYELGNYEVSLEYLQKSLKMHEQRGDGHGIADVLLCLGELYMRQKQYPLALENLEKSLKMIKGAKGRNERQVTLYSLKNIAEIYQIQKNYDKSIEYAKKSVEIAQELKQLVEIGITSKTLYEAYKGKGDYAHAFQYLELHKQTEDSLFSVNKTKALANLEAKAEIEKQKVEIEKQKEAREFQQYITYLILAGLLLVLVFAYFIFKFGQKQKKAKEEIQQAKEEIEAQAEELERLNQFKDRLFSIIAHDLRSPMATLRGTISILDPNILNQAELTTIKTELIKQFEVTDKILQDLLQWTKDQMKGETIEQKTLNFNEMVNEKINLFTPIAESKQISLLSEVMPDTQVLADENHVNIILQNLLSNALKFTYSGGIITITSKKLDKMVQITVKDTGKGMNKDQQSKLFSTQHFTTKGTADEKGNGLGLHLVKDLVEKNGGKIWVTSEEEKGSAFCFLLPTV